MKKTAAFLLGVIFALIFSTVCFAVSDEAEVTLSSKEKIGKKGFYITVDVTSNRNLGAAELFAGYDISDINLKNAELINKLSEDRTDYSVTNEGAHIICMTKGENVHNISLRLNFDYISDKENNYISCNIIKALDANGSEIPAGKAVAVNVCFNKTESVVVSESSKQNIVVKSDVSEKKVPVLQSSFTPQISVPAAADESLKVLESGEAVSENAENVINIVNDNEENKTEKQFIIIGAGVLVSFGAVGTALVLKKKNNKQ